MDEPTTGKSTLFSPGEHFGTLTEGQIAQATTAQANDVVRAGLRLREEQEAKLAVLRAALVEGETSGPSTPFDFDAFIARKRAEENEAS